MSMCPFPDCPRWLSGNLVHTSVRALLSFYFLFCFFIYWFERGERERERERETSICLPHIYAFIGSLLYGHWPEIDPTTLTCQGYTLANWATRPGLDHYCFWLFCIPKRPWASWGKDSVLQSLGLTHRKCWSNEQCSRTPQKQKVQSLGKIKRTLKSLLEPDLKKKKI